MVYCVCRQPHADGAYFESGLTKTEIYAQVIQQTKALIEGNRNWVSNFANAASLLWHGYMALPAPHCHVNWAGFYIRKDQSPSPAQAAANDAKNHLVLGPFQGKPACQHIPFGKGVCGSAAANRCSIIVSDVIEYPNHISCDSESRSEIVVPILVNGETMGLIDIDCTRPAAFDAIDRLALEALAKVLSRGCDWSYFTS